jgi:rubredoxin
VLPEPLVTIRTYSTADEAQGALAALDAEGIVAYVRVQGHGRGGGAAALLNVAESDAERALRTIGPSPDEDAEAEANVESEYACPRCRSSRSKALPPYFLFALIACVVILGLLASRQLWSWLAAFAAAGTLALGRLERRAPHWRCLNCGLAWNQNAERRRRDDARRHAVE